MTGPAAPCPLWLQQRFEQSGGSVPFSQFMAWALHDPEHGAYGSGQLKIGKGGDFATSATLGPDFSALMGCQLVQWLRALGLNHPTKTLSIVEVGPGEAELSCDLIDHLAEHLPDLMHRLELVLVEINPGMEQRQRKRLGRHQDSRNSQPLLPHRWTSLTELKASPVIGVLIAHELLDAFPVERLELVDGQLRRQTVHLHQADACEVDLHWGTEPIPQALQERINSTLSATQIALPPPDAEDGWTTEWHDACASWFAEASEALTAGHLLVVDYALEAHRYYSARRREGTLMAYRNQRASQGFLVDAGQQDLTAHLCLETMVHQATTHGWTLEGQCRQGEALLALGLAERFSILQQLPGSQLAELLQRREALLRLVDPACLGEFRWLSFLRFNPLVPSTGTGERSQFLQEPSVINASTPSRP
jgi:SAM-dependent MidA family methyltransferase